MSRLALRLKTKKRHDAYEKALKEGKEESFPTRRYNRCTLCGRGGAYMRFFKICRICFRELARRGEINGVKKSSW